jgi:hypothetical protein
VVTLAGQVVQQPAVGRVAGGSGHQSVNRSLQRLDLGGELPGVQGGSVAVLAQRQCVLQDAAHRVRGLGLPGDRVADQLTAAPQQMRQAALMGGMLEAAVGRPAVAFQPAGVASPRIAAASLKPRPCPIR